MNRPWASNEYQPLSTNTELILTIVYLVVDPTVTAKVINTYMLQTFHLFLIISIENAGQNLLDITNLVLYQNTTSITHDSSLLFGFQRLAKWLVYPCRGLPGIPQEFFVFKSSRPTQPGSERYGANLTGQV